jgi:hypothetical protein
MSELAEGKWRDPAWRDIISGRLFFASFLLAEQKNRGRP